jgi:saccharopine dehydrogenase-like NADP-dependent oxidoreductase
MKRIILLGSGLSATNLIKYLLDHSEEYNWHLAIGDIDPEVPRRKVQGHPRGSVFYFDIFDDALLDATVRGADVVVSFLPASFHPKVAAACLEARVHMITASYVSKEMKLMDEEAKTKGLLFLNELGVDPGIDHMSAMRIIDEIRSRGGKMVSFKSSTGGLIAPEFDNNPWHYKFTWNPRNVVLAGQGVSQFIRNGMYKYIPYHKLFDRMLYTEVPGYGDFEIYPNRDSLKYRATYGLEEIPTMFRGTMRRPGYSEAWNVFVQLGITDDTYTLENSLNMTYREFINAYLRYDPDMPVEEKLCRYLDLDPEGEVMKKMQWLGVFENRVIGMPHATPAQILQRLLEEKWALEPGDKDMIVMQHEIIYELDNQQRQITSSMVVIGKDREETAMSITVGTPVAIAIKLLLSGEIHLTGVHIPVLPELYEPILTELETFGIAFHDVESLPDTGK